MKTIFFEELKTLTEKNPLYCVLSTEPQKNGDPRAIGCGILALLNLSMLAKKRMGKDKDQTAYEILFNEILPRVEEQDDLSIQPESAFSFIDQSPLFNGWRMLVLNPSAMNPEVFWKIALKRLLGGDVALCMLEVPDQSGAEAKGIANHLSVVHSEGDEVFYDGLRMTAATLSNILFFSPINTVIFLSSPPEVANG